MSDSIIVRVTLDHYDFAHPAEQQTQVYVQIPEVARASWMLPADRYNSLRDAEWGEVLDAAHTHYEQQWVVSDSTSASARTAVRDWLAVDQNRQAVKVAWLQDQARRHPVARRLLKENARLLTEAEQRTRDLADVSADRDQLRAKLTEREEADRAVADLRKLAPALDVAAVYRPSSRAIDLDLSATAEQWRVWQEVLRVDLDRTTSRGSVVTSHAMWRGFHVVIRYWPPQQGAESSTAGAEVFVPRTERERWVDIANALNAAHAAGMPVGIDLDGTLTDHRMWSVVWDRGAEQWTVAGYGPEADT